jgi:UDP:flavonoid glycosyltransferase YjiC (YdhE family)
MLTSATFEYPHGDWPDSIHYCGPGLWQPPFSAPGYANEPGSPFVLVTVSSEAQRDERLLEVALEALAGLPYRVVATSAAHEPGRFRPPANAHVERFLPHAAFLPRAAAVVCHGGMGITQRALSFGVPVCVVPHGRDQLEVGRRVERARAGVTLPPRGLRRKSLRLALERTLACRAGARQVAEEFAQYGGPRVAADRLLACLEEK